MGSGASSGSCGIRGRLIWSDRCGKCTAGDCPGRDPEGKRADGQAIWCEYYASESEC